MPSAPVPAAGQLRTGAGVGYAFDNASVHAAEQHRCLAEMLDEITTTRLASTGIGPGWRCLEVGAGGGSVAVWLAGRVAPTGRVLATDINPVHIPATDGLDVLRHDIVHDPLPEASFDLIHARLVLLHLPERRSVLGRLANALRPGGWLQLDEFDIGYGPSLLMPGGRAAEIYGKFLAAKARMFRSAGADGTWGRKVPRAMNDVGLVDITPTIEVQTWRAGSPGTSLLIHHTFHLRDRLVEAGMTDEELQEVRAVMAHPQFMAASCPIYLVQGRRPSL